ncbi:MAG: CapA family protein [Bacteroidales bacterium]|nr:CapA family protein [Bacteroidales bacterium]
MKSPKHIFTTILLVISLFQAEAQVKYDLKSPEPILQSPDTVSMVFIGDVMMHKKQLDYDYRAFLEPIRTRLTEADVAVANMEFTLAGEPYTGYPAFSAPDGFASYVADCGVDIFLLANNHILDKGQQGAIRTLDVYDRLSLDRGTLYTGLSRYNEDYEMMTPLMVNVKGVRIALVNFTYGTNSGGNYEWPKVNRIGREEMTKAIRRAKEAGAEFVIVLPHWGAEYHLRHNSTQSEVARWCVEAGADAIIGAHPHVVQDTTHISDVPVIYSMGNAVSNMSARYTRLELMVRLRFANDGNGVRRLLEPEVEFLWCTLPGTLTDNYATIPLRDYLGKKDLWKAGYDYDNMINTWKTVRSETGIKDAR